MVGGMRRILAPFVAACVLTLLAVATPFAVPTTAVPSADRAAAACQPTGYPDGQHAAVQVNTTVPHVGDPLEVSGIVYCPNEAVRIFIAGERVGTGHTDAHGRFDPPIITPGPPGPKRLCGNGVSGFAFDRDCLVIHVQGSGGSSPAGPTNHGGGTAFTGVQIALLGLLALVLVVGGVVVTTLGRNRRPERA
jgi:hypothetical protein